MIDGDQSYHSWRRLGDVVSSLYALGYHERVDLTAIGSATLGSLRSEAFCRAYSADKNVSIFLGRPSRMHRSHSFLDLSFNTIGSDSSIESFEYAQETRWTVACAILKERSLDLARFVDAAARTQAMHIILQDCVALEASLPSRYQLPGHLKDFQGTAVERDFVASAALNILHVRFLMHSSPMQGASEIGSELIIVSAAMLKLVGEITILKATLANSGTGFIWKIIFYGLPAAGIICLALINRGAQNADTSFSVPQAMQDLSVIVAHVEAGVLLSPDQPNYALLQAATVTIKSVLHTLNSGSLIPTTQDGVSTEQASRAIDPWMPWAGDNDFFDFELDFWTNLAEHPALYQDAA
ncbi:uncharacterized protein RCC_03958 [Ramularia collo-cygni]|uniref:Transcription factor domain-containing protein n=1 Tax=Ramularia collo-cygni TaxID=112498 RepID=A0A2D3UT66_9PEZI|nr:uncharacterized protein RCC_03958 [Ramularia collo-cygni]CZT18118.1 uncharacterized protein RCC_03958 [Ramularia collo-cygni]